jgi:uncharacterized protein (TIGR02246 family)
VLFTRASTVLGALALTTSCALHPVRNERADVRTAVDKLIAADNRGDLEFAVASYRDDAVMFPPGGREPVRGRKAIRASYAALFAAWTPQLEITHHSTTIADGVGVDRGRTRGVLMSMTGGESKRVDDEYEATLVREDSLWRVKSLAWRPYTPPQAGVTPAPFPR